MLTQQASPTRSTLNQTGNRHHNHQWHWKAIWNARNLRLPPSFFSNEKDNLSAQQREALKTLSANKEINLKKADKGTTTVIMDTRQKIQEGLEQVSNENFYKPLETPIVSSTAAKVGNIVKTLFDNGHIDNMTYKWLSSGQNPPRIPEFYTLTKIHKNTPVGRPIVSGSSGPTERISSFVDSLLQPIAQNKSHISKTLPTLSTSLKTLHFPTERF